MTRITTLIENNAGSDARLRHEHGISFLVEHGETTLLFDTGQSGGFIDNAQVLQADLSAVEHVVISHGHYDHADGFPHFVDAVSSEPLLHIHRDFFDRKLVDDGGPLRFRGAAFDRTWLENHNVRVSEVTGRGSEIAPGVHIVAAFEPTHPLEVRNPRFVVERIGSSAVEIDDFRDEISIVLETEKGLVILVGCSHPGIMNMLTAIRSRFSAPVCAVLGGTHLIEAKGERLAEAVSFLTDGTCGRLGLSHCTGEAAMAELERESGDFYRNVTGSRLVV